MIKASWHGCLNQIVAIYIAFFDYSSYSFIRYFSCRLLKPNFHPEYIMDGRVEIAKLQNQVGICLNASYNIY